ncbi:hypothetical protein BY996DRAFT_6573220 [Phakopsora pachyrhizi]|nr:hypothetical protein BY996DRAFT_6573220 [Phakopsora pachyrhizi]
MNSGETIKFYLALMDQYKESDEIWFDQRTLEAEIDGLRRDYRPFQLDQSQARSNPQPAINSESSDRGKCQSTSSPDNGLLERVSEARKITESRYRSHRELRSVRSNWKRLIAFRTEISRLIYKSLLVIDQDASVHQIGQDHFKVAEELEQLEKEAPCQVEGGPTSTPGKVNILLQAYISRLHNAARIARALVDIGVWKKLADTARVMIEMAKCIDSKIAKSQDSSWLVNHSLPELKKTESFAKQIANQTRSIVAIQSETDLNVLEGGMLMKTIQDLIGHKLERNFDGDEDSVEKVRQEKVAGQDNQLKTCEVQEMVMKFSEVVRRFDNSLPGRIQFLAQEGIEELKTEDGGMVLNAARHNELVRGHLNKLS